MDLKKKRILGIPLIYVLVVLLATGASAAIYYGMSNTVSQETTVERPVTLEINDGADNWGLTSAWTGTGYHWSDMTGADLPYAQKVDMRNSVYNGNTYDGYIELTINGTGMVDGEIDAAYYTADGISFDACSVTFNEDHYLIKTTDLIAFNGDGQSRIIYVFWNYAAYSEGSPYLATAVITPT